MIEIKHKFSYVCILKSYQGPFLFIYLFLSMKKFSSLCLSLLQSLKEGLTVQERMKLFETKDSRKI